jgi:hypothetical protein
VYLFISEIRHHIAGKGTPRSVFLNQTSALMQQTPPPPKKKRKKKEKKEKK